MTTPDARTVNKYSYRDGIPKSVLVHQLPGYATWIPDRRPAFKPHNTLGQAKNAINMKPGRGEGFRYDMGIYRLFGDEYILTLKIHQGSRREDYPELAPPPPTAQQIKHREDRERRADEARLDRLRREAADLEAKIGDHT